MRTRGASFQARMLISFWWIVILKYCSPWLRDGLYFGGDDSYGIHIEFYDYSNNPNAIITQ
jgi:hypothetical protein